MEGPTKLFFPAREELHCSGCKYYDYHLVKSGHHPVYAKHCTHPTVEQSMWCFEGNLPKDGITPEWCPYLKKNERSTY